MKAYLWMMELPAQLWMISLMKSRANFSLVGRLAGLLTADSRSSKILASVSKLLMYCATPCRAPMPAQMPVVFVSWHHSPPSICHDQAFTVCVWWRAVLDIVEQLATMKLSDCGQA